MSNTFTVKTSDNQTHKVPVPVEHTTDQEILDHVKAYLNIGASVATIVSCVLTHRAPKKTPAI